MIIEKLKLLQFNNYDNTDISWHPKFNAITGLNGMGKTNILDAIYYLCLGRSYFNFSDRHVVQQGKDGFRLEGHFNNQGDKDILEIKAYPGKSKDIIKSGVKVKRITDHVGNFPCVIVAPADIQLMLEGSEERRKFLNNTIMQFDNHYSENLLNYSRVLKQRNALLKQFAEKHYFDGDLLESITVQMYRPSDVIFKARAKMIERLSELFTQYYNMISGNRETCEIIYKSHLLDNDAESLARESLQKDKILNRTTKGIHKDDITFKMNDNLLKNFASQGQLKSFVLALKLAQYEILSEIKKSRPILLLDDIFDKLDKERVAHLLDIVGDEKFGQIFISDTNLDRIPGILEDKNVSFAPFKVDKGTIKKYDV